MTARKMIASPSDAAFTGDPVFSNQLANPRTHKVAGTVTINTDDHTVIVKKTVGAATPAVLPANPINGQAHRIKDGKGDAGTNNITVSTADGKTIDGASTFVINVNYSSLEFMFSTDTGEWSVV